jgi:hypothetical protein
LFFLLKVEQFEYFSYVSFDARAEAAALVYDTYIHPAGLLYVGSITSAVRKITKEIVYRCTVERSDSIAVAFNAAKLQVWDVLEQVFSHFKEENGTIHALLNKHFGSTSVEPLLTSRARIHFVWTNGSDSRREGHNTTH